VPLLFVAALARRELRADRAVGAGRARGLGRATRTTDAARGSVCRRAPLRRGALPNRPHQRPKQRPPQCHRRTACAARQSEQHQVRPHGGSNAYRLGPCGSLTQRGREQPGDAAAAGLHADAGARECGLLPRQHRRAQVRPPLSRAAPPRPTHRWRCGGGRGVASARTHGLVGELFSG
jgi:hypothetical protein